MDPPLILTHNHDPNVIFRAQFPFKQPESPQSPTIPFSYSDLWSNFQRMSNSYNDLIIQNRELSEAYQALQQEYNTLRDTYLRLRYKHQEVVDDAMHGRIESWRHAVRLEELKKELGLLKQGETQPRSSKRKSADTDEDNGEASDWSAFSHSQSHTFSNDTFNTPTSGSSFKLATTASIAQPTLNDSFISFRPRQLVASGEDSTGIRTPKRRRYDSGSCPPHSQDLRRTAAGFRGDGQDQTVKEGGVTPTITLLQCREGTTTLRKPTPKCTTNARRSPPQTRSKTRMFRNRHPSVDEQNATAAAVAAALIGSVGASNRDLPS